MTPSARDEARRLCAGWRGRFVFMPDQDYEIDRLVYAPDGEDEHDLDVCTVISEDLDGDVARPLAAFLNLPAALLSALDERDREVERLGVELRCEQIRSEDRGASYQEAQAEIERLRAEVERLTRERDEVQSYLDSARQGTHSYRDAYLAYQKWASSFSGLPFMLASTDGAYRKAITATIEQLTRERDEALAVIASQLPQGRHPGDVDAWTVALGQIADLRAQLEIHDDPEDPTSTYCDDDGEFCESCCEPLAYGADVAEFTENDGRGLIRRVVMHRGPCPTPADDPWIVEWSYEGGAVWPREKVPKPYEEARADALAIKRMSPQARVRLVRCVARDPETGIQCTDVDDHMGPHGASVSDGTVLLWPSRDCIEEARVEAEIDAMSDEQIDAVLVEAGGREHLEQWKAGTMAFVKGAINLNRRIGELERDRDGLRAELESLRQPPAVDGLDLAEILAKARAAKEEAGSGTWSEAEESWTRGHVQSKPGPITSRDDSPRIVASPNPNFPGGAIVAHIASACPDTVVALVERLRRAESETAKWRRAGFDGIDSMADALGREQAKVAARDLSIDAHTERIRELLATNAYLLERQQSHLRQIATLSAETPFPGEANDLESARRKHLAEIGTLRAHVAELERGIRGSGHELDNAIGNVADAGRQLQDLRTAIGNMATALEVIAASPRAFGVELSLRGLVAEMRGMGAGQGLADAERTEGA